MTGIATMDNSEENRTNIDLLFTNLSLAMAFLEIAETSKNGAAHQRNRNHAWDAQRAALRLLSRVTLTADENQLIQQRLSVLKNRLEAAGSRFPDI